VYVPIAARFPPRLACGTSNEVGRVRCLRMRSRPELINHRAMSDKTSPQSPFIPERYRREAARVRREAEATLDAAVSEKLFDIARRFDVVAETMERSRV
jgi:hypothetical protein